MQLGGTSLFRWQEKVAKYHGQTASGQMEQDLAADRRDQSQRRRLANKVVLPPSPLKAKASANEAARSIARFYDRTTKPTPLRWPCIRKARAKSFRDRAGRQYFPAHARSGGRIPTRSLRS